MSLGGIAPDGLESEVAARDQLDLETLFLEVVAQHLGDVRLVLDEGDSFGRHLRDPTMEFPQDLRKTLRKSDCFQVHGPSPRGFVHIDQKIVQSV